MKIIQLPRNVPEPIVRSKRFAGGQQDRSGYVQDLTFRACTFDRITIANKEEGDATPAKGHAAAITKEENPVSRHNATQEVTIRKPPGCYRRSFEREDDQKGETSINSKPRDWLRRLIRRYSQTFPVSLLSFLSVFRPADLKTYS